MARARLCLGVEVQGGKEHAARHGLSGLARPPAFRCVSPGVGWRSVLGENPLPGLAGFLRELTLGLDPILV